MGLPFIRLLSFFIVIAVGVFMVTVEATSYYRNNNNPYTVLNISPSATKKQLKHRYYQLCLKYHPDKIPNHYTPKQRQSCIDQFKQVQWAYNEITSFSKSSSNYNDHYQRPNPFGMDGRSTRSTNPSSKMDPSDVLKQFFAQYYNNNHYNSGLRGGLYHRSYGFGNSFGRPQNNHYSNKYPFTTGKFYSTPSSTTTSSFYPNKFIYQQRVTIPLSDLYCGIHQYHFPFRNTIWTRIRAAIRGGIINDSIIYQSLLYSIPLLRVSKYCSLFLFCYMIYQQIQQIPVYDAVSPTRLVANILSGYKENTKIIFTSQLLENDAVEIQYFLNEGKHLIYHRIPNSNDLFASCTISPQQALSGCTIKIPSLRNTKETNYSVRLHQKSKKSNLQHQEQTTIDDDESSIAMYVNIRVPPNTKANDTIRVPGKGWPIRKQQQQNQRQPTQTQQQQQYGDLICQIQIRSHPSYDYKNKNDTIMWLQRWLWRKQQ